MKMQDPSMLSRPMVDHISAKIIVPENKIAGNAIVTFFNVLHFTPITPRGQDSWHIFP